MPNYTMLTIRIPKEVEDLLTALGEARKAMNEADTRKDHLVRNQTTIIEAAVAGGDNEKAAQAAWDAGFKLACEDFERAHFAMHQAGDNLATWWNAVNLPF